MALTLTALPQDQLYPIAHWLADTTGRTGADMKRLLHFATVMMIIFGFIGASQTIAMSTVSAGTVPPPASCTSGDYNYENPECWGNAGNPPSGCLPGDGTVNTTTACLRWKSEVPDPAALVEDVCGNGQIQGPLGVCCPQTDTICLSGTITTPQGSTESLALAASICNNLSGVEGIEAADIPYACTVGAPTVQAALAGCNVALANFNSSESSSPLWGDCVKLVISSAGEVKTGNPPLASDEATAAYVCQTLAASADAIDIPAGCDDSPVKPSVGVQACKILLENEIVSVSNELGGACLDLIVRNPSDNLAGGTQTPQAVPFDDTNLARLTSGLTYFALVLCVGGVMVAAGLWIQGARSNNGRQEVLGRQTLIVCITAAFIIGALPQIFEFFDDNARHVDTNSITAGN